MIRGAEIVLVFLPAHHVTSAVHEGNLVVGTTVMHMLSLEVSVHDHRPSIFPAEHVVNQ